MDSDFPLTPSPSYNKTGLQDLWNSKSTHALTHAPTHALPSLPVNPNPILTPPDIAPSGGHDTAAKYLKKIRKLANIRPSLQFYGMIILVKIKPLCRGMAWLPFQKFGVVNFILLNWP